MRLVLPLAAFLAAATCQSYQAVRADDAPPVPAPVAKVPLPATEAGVQEQLKTFDPAAVAAARHFYQSPVMKTAMLSRMKGTVAAIKRESADITNKYPEADREKFLAENNKMLAVIEKTTADNYDYMLGLHMIAALQIFSKDELIALDTFYSSPVGQGVVMKMPLLNKRIPDVMHAVVPKMFEAMKASGLDAP